MRKLSLFLALAMVLAFVGGAIAQTVVISVDNITNTYTDGLRAGATHVVSLRYDARNAAPPGDPPAYWAGSNEFEIYSPEGAQWTSMTGAYGPLTNQLAPSVNKYRKHNFFDGTTWNPVPTSAGNGPVGPSTGATCRASFWLTIADFNGTDGWEGGVDNDIAITLTFSTLVSDGTLTGDKTMCIDTSIANVAWEWGNPTQDFPVWDNNGGLAGVQDGPRCLKIYTVPNLPPVWCNPSPGVNPSNYTFKHCEAGGFDLCATDPDDPDTGPITYSFVPGFEHGEILGNHWSWAGVTVPQSGFVTVKFRAFDTQGYSETDLTVELTITNDAPTISCPTGTLTLGIGKCDSVKFTAGDAETCDDVIVTTTAPAIIRGSYVVYCPVLGDELTNPHVFTLTASDGGLQAQCNVSFKAIKGAPYQIELEKKAEQIQGVFTDVFIKLYGVDQNGIGGFDFLVAYDASALAFQLAYGGQIYNQDTNILPGCGWEYFTYRFGAYGNCGNACPSGLLRVIGLAETNNGPNHPDCQDTPYYGETPVTLAQLRFLVSNDRTLECSFVPIRFFWIECGDNALSSADGSLLMLSDAVYDFANYGSAFIGTSIAGVDDYPTYLGAQAECICTPNSDPTCKVAAIRAVDFQNGGVDIVCADSIDARGDINLNGLAYEIADAVMFTNYFIAGIGAFGTHVEGSIAASDTNADGLALTVADLVYLIRVVIGDAQPYDKAIPVAASVTIGDGNFSVDVPMGAAHIVIAGEVTPTLLATNMEMKYGVVDGNTNILVFSTEANQSFTGQFLNAEGRVISANLATFLGQPVNATVMPANFALHQNYPNPFNPTTTFKIDIPKVGVDWTLNIYNVTGQLVQNFSGVSTGSDVVVWDASNNASGIYFYKLTAGDFSATKKAVLLK